MAKVTYGPIVSEGRGKVGDVVLNRNRGGNFVRALKVPEPPITTHNLLSATHLDTTPTTPPVRGDLITGQAVAPLWKRLAKGTPGQVLGCDADDVKWVAAPATGVTSVGLVLPAEFDVTGSPVTGAGDLTGAWADQDANKVLAGPTSGAADAPAFRALVAADIPPLIVLSRDVDITAAQIKAWNVTPIEVIPAPGANKAIDLINAVLHYKYGTVVYATCAGSVFLITNTAQATSIQWSAAITVFLIAAFDQTVKAAAAALLTRTSYFTNLPLYLWGGSATQPTNGDGTIRLHMIYRILDVP